MLLKVGVVDFGVGVLFVSLTSGPRFHMLIDAFTKQKMADLREI